MMVFIYSLRTQQLEQPLAEDLDTQHLWLRGTARTETNSSKLGEVSARNQFSVSLTGASTNVPATAPVYAPFDGANTLNTLFCVSSNSKAIWIRLGVDWSKMESFTPHDSIELQGNSILYWSCN
jgi:hypothetical protein